MKANTRRGNRLAFDAVAGSYDRARPEIPAGLVADIVGFTGLAPGERVLDIGAGTGQLTMPLREAGLNVTALEPGGTLRKLLEKKTARDGGVTVRGGFFEAYDGAEDGPFAAVFSANAFHWIDPAVSYTRAARLLRPGGYLVLLWNIPTVEDDALRVALNERAFADHPDFVRDGHPRMEALAADGAEEMTASGRYETPRVVLRSQPLVFTPDDYVTLLISYANGAVLPPKARKSLGDGVRTVLADHHAESIRVVNSVYAVIGRRAGQ